MSVNMTMGDGRPAEHGPRSVEPVAPRGRASVADDDVLLREGLARLPTRSGYQVVDQPGDGGRLVELVDQTPPALVTVNTRMPPTCTTEGLQAARTIREK